MDAGANALQRVLIAAALLAVSSCAPALGCCSGLVVIPTADIVGSGEYCIEPQYDGTFASDSADVRLLNTQFGIAPRLEAGLDFDLSDDVDADMLVNAKYLLVPAAGRGPAVAAGINSVGRRTRSSPYAVATHDFRGLRGHLGVMRIEGSDRWFIGADRAIGDRFTVMADYTSGDENCSSIGFGYQETDRFGILAGVLFPNDSSEATGFSVHLVFSGM